MGKAVNHFEQMVVTRQRWKQPYVIDVDVFEAFLGCFNPLAWILHVDLYLVALPLDASVDQMKWLVTSFFVARIPG